MDSDKIRQILKEKNMTQKEFADRCGVSMSCVGDWLRGSNIPCGYNLVKVVKVLECSVEDLFGE